MIKIEHLLNFEALGRETGFNAKSLRSIIWRIQKGQLPGESPLVARATEALNIILSTYLCDRHLDVIRTMAIAETAIGGGQRLSFDQDSKTIFLQYENGTKQAKIEPGTPQFDSLCFRLFGSIKNE